MRSVPVLAASGLALVLGGPLAILALVGSSDPSAIWVAVHTCARTAAAAASLPVLLAMGLAASILALGLAHALRQARLSARAVRLARRHRVAAPGWLRGRARRLGVERLIVTDLPSELAYCAGLWRPSVVVSTSLLTAVERDALEAILAHEAAHSARRDPLRQVLAEAVARSLWVAPAAVLIAHHRRLKLEVAADRAAAAHAGRKALARALLTLHQPPLPAGAAIAGGAAMLRPRIDALVDGTRPRLTVGRAAGLRSAAGLLLCAAIVLLAAAGPRVGRDPLLPMPMNDAGVEEMGLAWLVRLSVAAAAWSVVRLILSRRVIAGRGKGPSA